MRTEIEKWKTNKRRRYDSAQIKRDLSSAGHVYPLCSVTKAERHVKTEAEK